MSRYIDAEALKAKGVKMYGFGDRKYVPVSAIDLAPTADGAPMVHAHWEVWEGNDYVCSNCAEFAPSNSRSEFSVRTDFCPHCGAKMDERVTDNV